MPYIKSRAIWGLCRGAGFRAEGMCRGYVGDRYGLG